MKKNKKNKGQEKVTVSAYVASDVSSKITKTAEILDRTPSYVTAKILEFFTSDDKNLIYEIFAKPQTKKTS